MTALAVLLAVFRQLWRGPVGDENIHVERNLMLDLALAPFVEGDLAELVVLQRCCWVQEAILNNTLVIPALHESAAEVLGWTTKWVVLCVRRRGRLVAAVRARPDGDSWEIGRLMVAPDLAGQGIGRWLLGRAEGLAPTTVSSFTLYTGRDSIRNIRLYQRAGYHLVEPPAGADGHIQGAVLLVKPTTPH